MFCTTKSLLKNLLRYQQRIYQSEFTFYQSRLLLASSTNPSRSSIDGCSSRPCSARVGLAAHLHIITFSNCEALISLAAHTLLQINLHAPVTDTGCGCQYVFQTLSPTELRVESCKLAFLT